MDASKSYQNYIEKREALFMELYKKAFPPVAAYICKMGGDFDEAKDIFQDALLIYYEKQMTGSFSPDYGESAYLLGIARHLWLKKYKDKGLTFSLDNFDAETEIVLEEYAKPSPGKLKAFLGATGQRCMEMLKAFYYHKMPVAEIATVFGYSGVRSATVQKYKCLEKVRDKIKEKSLVYEDFIE